MNWSRIKFYYDSIPGAPGSVIVATTEEAGSPVENIYSMTEVNRWSATNTASPHYVTVDLGAGNPARSADYLAIIGHNLKTIGAAVTLQYSADNFAADVNDSFTPETAGADAVYLKEFTQTAAKRYWRLKITGTLTAAPCMAICIWGNRTELDYASSSFDPHAQDVKANVNISYGGYVTGVHTMYTERSMSLKFEDADPALYNKIKTWRETSGLNNFFVAWERTNSPSDIYLMRPDPRFENPLKNGGLYRDITINLKGRKE